MLITPLHLITTSASSCFKNGIHKNCTRMGIANGRWKST